MIGRGPERLCYLRLTADFPGKFWHFFKGRKMYAIIDLSGEQHRIEKDQVFVSELTGNEAGKEFSCDQVMLVGEGSSVKVGKPYVSGAAVKLKVLEEIKAPKITGFKYKPKTGYRKSWGHRQKLHKLQVLDIKGA